MHVRQTAARIPHRQKCDVGRLGVNARAELEGYRDRQLVQDVVDDGYVVRCEIPYDVALLKKPEVYANGIDVIDLA